MRARKMHLKLLNIAHTEHAHQYISALCVYLHNFSCVLYVYIYIYNFMWNLYSVLVGVSSSFFLSFFFFSFWIFFLQWLLIFYAFQSTEFEIKLLYLIYLIRFQYNFSHIFNKSNIILSYRKCFLNSRFSFI